MATRSYDATDELTDALNKVALAEDASLMGMHLSEIEEEATNVLDLIIALRVAARDGDAGAGQEALAEITVALDHLVDHARFLLPSLKVQLDLEDDSAAELNAGNA